MSDRDERDTVEYVASLHRKIDTLRAQQAHDKLKIDGLQKRLAATDGVTQELVDAVRRQAGFAPEGYSPPIFLDDAADILQALLDAGGDDE